ncbi:MAG: MBL fold metallo-hydrolase [Candidatus Dormibacteria bacterium]
MGQPDGGLAGSALTLTVLGCRSGAPDAESACSGYLLTSGARTILVDCGPGIATALARTGLGGALDAVVVTHKHADHSLDLVALAYGRRFPEPLPGRLPLWFPEASLDYLAQLDEVFGIATVPDLGRPLSQAFEIRPLRLDGATSVEVVPGVSMTAYAARHAVPSAALRFATATATITFSSDTGWADSVIEAATNSDLFACEATYLEASPAQLDGHGHLTPDLAGQLATRASARHLVLTHLSRWDDAEASLEHARRSAPDVEALSLARPGATWTVGA